MKIQIEPVTSQNREIVLAMKPALGQEGFLEPVEQCLQEAQRRRCWRPVLLSHRGEPVGFAMYGFFWEYPPLGRLWLDRFLIDQSMQGRGYGRGAMEALLARLDREYRHKTIYLSVVEGNRGAVALYGQFGFSFTGERDIHGEWVMRRIPPKG